MAAPLAVVAAAAAAMPAAPAAAAAPASATTLQFVAGLPPPDLSMPALAPAKNREQYRERPEGEMEEAQWYSAEEPDTLVGPEQVRLKSIHSKQASVIVFSNKSPYKVRALWLDFQGNEVVYSVLEPKAVKRYHTYITHPWIVRELDSGTRMLLSGRPAVVGREEEQTVEIMGPPELQWSMSTHSCFPESYKSSVKGLLLAHKKLEPFAAATHGPKSALIEARSTFCPAEKTALPTNSSNGTSLSVFSSPPCSPITRRPSPSPLSPRSCNLMAKFQTSVEQQQQQPMSPKAGRASRLLPPLLGPLSPRKQQPPAYSASPVEAAATTTSISISSEAAHFTATLTVSSPKRAVMTSTVNINVTAGCDGMTTVNFGTVLAGGLLGGGDAAVSSAAGPAPMQLDSGSSGSSSSLAPLGAGGGKKSGFLSMFKNMLNKPSSSKHAAAAARCDSAMEVDQSTSSVGTTTTATFHVEVHTQDTDMADAAGPEESSAVWPPVDTHLGNLPSHLLLYISELAAPLPQYQTMMLPPKGRPDIKPTLMACPPNTAEQEQQEEEGNADNDALPALLPAV